MSCLRSHYPVTATTVVLGALAARDWRPMHHDRDFAVHRNGTRDIFLNTPNLAHWFERFVTDWTGPYGRLGRMNFRMLGSIFPGDTMVFEGRVTERVHRRHRAAVGPSSRSPCPSTVSERRPAGPGWPCRPATTTTPGSGRASNGDPEPAHGSRRSTHRTSGPPRPPVEETTPCWT